MLSIRETTAELLGDRTGDSRHPFDVDTEPRPAASSGSAGGPDRYLVSLSRRWWVQRGPNGGYAAAVMLRAMQASAGSRPPRVLTVQFPKAPQEGEVEIEVSTVRAGRSISFLSATMVQAGETVVTAQAAFGAEREGSTSYDGEEARLPADAGDPGELVAFDASERVPAVIANFSFRSVGPVPLSGSPGEARTGGWLTPREPRGVDAPFATTILDVWVPAPFIKLERPAPAPTLSYTVHFLTALPLAHSEPTDPYLIDVRSSLAREGYFEERARLWHRNGTLIAHANQVALL